MECLDGYVDVDYFDPSCYVIILVTCLKYMKFNVISILDHI